MDEKTKILVIGAGPGGYTAAFHLADLGADVTLVDKRGSLGGICLHEGCIPSKTLLHAAKILTNVEEAKNFGIEFENPKIDIDKLRQKKQEIISKLSSGLDHLCKKRKINFIEGTVQFVDSNNAEISDKDGAQQTLSFDKAILATGSSPKKLDILPESDLIMDSSSALELKDIPETMLIVGGGYIGLELGTVYAKLGSQVSVVELTDGLLPGVDRDLVRTLERQLKQDFNSIMLSTKITNCELIENGVSITLEDRDGKTITENYQRILVATGRKPNLDNLEIENTKIKINDAGFIEVDDKKLTSDTSIYAIGDITKGPMLAHKASHEGYIVAKIINKENVDVQLDAIPAAIFTDPEIAICGLTENVAKEKGIEIKVSKFMWAASGRASTLDRADGTTKLIIDPKTEQILGASIVGVYSSELIAELALAIKVGLKTSDISKTIHVHPTLSETIMECAQKFYE
ncbi:MAG: dihydrolipoyl dehydrogenase [Candidatus Zapsychrus exili]|nr:dihydrolipoyl dehydrogenase [Candidatus Zapsychrus exili]